MKKSTEESLSEVEIPDSGELPEDWANVLLGDVCTHPQYGWTTSTDHNPDGLKIVRTSDISSGKIDWSTVPSCVLEPDHIEKYLLKSGDILISRAGSVGMSYKIQDCPRAVFASYLIRFRALDSIDTDYLEYFLKSRQYWESITDETIGITIPNVNASKLKNIPIPLPPLSEQQRIVARVDALFTHTNVARDRLRRVPLIMKKFRQAVLAAACSGRLTEGWREEYLHFENNRCDIEQILANRRKKWVINQKTKKYREPLPLENEDYPELPLLWSWASIDQIASTEPQSIQSGPFGSNLLHSEFQKEGILAIGIDNVLEGMFSLGKQHRISPQKYEELKKYSARPLDVLVTVMATIGRCCVVPKDIEKAIITKHVYRITVDKEIIDPFFLLFTLMGDPTVGDYIQSQIRGQTRPGINGEILKRAPIPIPPLAEQQEIVRRVVLLFERADAFDQEVAAAGRRCERLTQAVLGKAFQGKL